MSTIFSDPGWQRGGTLLASEVIDYDDAPANTVPTAGKELVGQVKIFQDVDPYTGVRKSNRLVYCVAARYTGASTLDSDGSDGGPAQAGKFVVFSNGLSEFSTFADSADVTGGLAIGVLDEYLTMDVRKNDIVWVVVKGPCQVQTVAGSSLAANKRIGLDTAVAGDTGLALDSEPALANQIGLSLGAAASDRQRINLMSNHI